MRRAAALAIALLAAACQEERIVLATVQPDASTTCKSAADCPSGAFCSKATCGAETGACEPVPASCDDDERPVCGCDTISYFNDCLRRRAKVESSAPNACPLDSGRLCGGIVGSTCDAGTWCGRLWANPHLLDCPRTSDAYGVCWVLPDDACPIEPPPPPSAGEPPPPLWDACDPQDPAHCVRTCDAVRSGHAFRRALQCQ